MPPRLAPALVTVGWLLLALTGWTAAGGLGFPDGHLTELDHARSLTWPGTAALGLIGAVGTLTLGRSHPRRAAVALGLAVAAAVLTDVTLASTLDHGAGG